MKRWWLSGSVRLWFLVILSGCLSAVAIQPGWAEIKPRLEKQEVQSQQNLRPLLTRKIRQLSEVKHPSTNAKLLVQSPANPPVSEDIVQVSGVKANPTDKGVEVILQTTGGEQLQVTNRSEGNNFIADIPNAQLRLPNGDAFTFRSQKPVTGITEITVTNLDANTIRVTVTGEASVPTVELFDSPDEGLIFGITTAATSAQQPQQPEQPNPTPPAAPLPLPRGGEGERSEQPSAQNDEPIELVVTGEQDGYRVPNASVGTRTDTPLRDIPQSIQVIPQQVLRDQNVTDLVEALRNVPGAGFGNTARSFAQSSIILRGFSSNSDILWNGLRENPGAGIAGFEAAGIERIEVLRGPNSVLYGQGGLGGIVNYITKQPLSEPYYSLETSVGNFNFYRGAIDLSGPLNDSRTVLYRLNLAAQTTESFFDFFEAQRYFVAPNLTWQISDRTKFTVAAEYLARPQTADQAYGLPVVGTVFPNPNGEIPRNRYVGEPDDFENSYSTRIGYDLEHRFSENWQLRNAFRFKQGELFRRLSFGTALAADNRTLNRGFFDTSEFSDKFFNSDTYVVGQFSTGSIRHQIVTGINLTKRELGQNSFNRQASPIDLYNPVYGQPLGAVTSRFSNFNTADTLGIYVQDQITLAENLKLLLGVRFDSFSQNDENRLTNRKTNQSDSAFSPRVGIVYQPIEPISLYASYSRSFTPTLGTSFDGDVFQPERGTQYEVGVKADLNNRLSATLAFYDLTRTNVLTTDTRPNVPPGFSIQTGEQKSRGVELTFGGEILPGWSIIAGYGYTDAKVTQDNTLPVGLRFRNVPENTFNLWTSYEIQRGNLQGLGFGLGLFFVGERPGDILNTFELPSYLRTDAAIFYKRDRFRAALNFRNLFDVDYLEASFNNVRVFRGDPLTVQGTISFEF
ncbi:TonB-dependent siderophore receptor [Chlorogloeopsis sp. ULAP01]|uniref:TonB-dependent siderophore receptor n=1 Tax=Chlorogloeopsis sp. ULAP01 TaxID=3056483 RepID=UPI0025AA7EE1|nr:TonB-dependent siderophore receptor [Chlorogloeopsis sp. ULAP01]MDM9379408.1 TonB-dependent siderophore receptor [Chlorogloeopsis sp. ULAP01]